MVPKLEPARQQRLKAKQVSRPRFPQFHSRIFFGFRFNVEAVVRGPSWISSELSLHDQAISILNHHGRLHIEHFQGSRSISKPLSAAIFILNRPYRCHIKLKLRLDLSRRWKHESQKQCEAFQVPSSAFEMMDLYHDSLTPVSGSREDCSADRSFYHESSQVEDLDNRVEYQNLSKVLFQTIGSTQSRFLSSPGDGADLVLQVHFSLDLLDFANLSKSGDIFTETLQVAHISVSRLP
jgi:hypothetical protein